MHFGRRHHHTVAAAPPRRRGLFSRRPARAHNHHHHTATTTTTTRPQRRSIFSRRRQVVHQRKPSIGDKISGALLKLRGTLTNRPGVKAAGTRRMHGTDGRGSHHNVFV